MEVLFYRKTRKMLKSAEENLALIFFPQICRLQRHLSAGEHQQDLFQNQPPMFVSQHSQPPTQNLVELIQLCGGTVCKTVRQAGICIGKYSGRIPQGSRVLSEQWVLGKIFSVVSILTKKHFICSVMLSSLCVFFFLIVLFQIASHA